MINNMNAKLAILRQKSLKLMFMMKNMNKNKAVIGFFDVKILNPKSIVTIKLKNQPSNIKSAEQYLSFHSVFHKRIANYLITYRSTSPKSNHFHANKPSRVSSKFARHPATYTEMNVYF